MKDWVNVVVDWVELTARRFDTVARPRLFVDAKGQLTETVAFTPFPSGADVSGSVELGNNFHSSDGGVVNQIFNILRTIDLTGRIGAVKGKKGFTPRDEGERVRDGRRKKCPP